MGGGLAVRQIDIKRQVARIDKTLRMKRWLGVFLLLCLILIYFWAEFFELYSPSGLFFVGVSFAMYIFFLFSWPKIYCFSCNAKLTILIPNRPWVCGSCGHDNHGSGFSRSVALLFPTTYQFPPPCTHCKRVPTAYTCPYCVQDIVFDPEKHKELPAVAHQLDWMPPDKGEERPRPKPKKRGLPTMAERFEEELRSHTDINVAEREKLNALTAALEAGTILAGEYEVQEDLIKNIALRIRSEG